MSPTTMYWLPGTALTSAVAVPGCGGRAGVYPGWGIAGWVPGRAIPGTNPRPSQDPYLTIF